MKKYFVLGLFLIGGIVAFGQKKSVHSNKKDVGFSIYTQYVDTLQKIHNKYFAGLDSLNNDTVPERNIEFMEVDLIFKIAAIGIIVAVLHQLLVRSGREEQAMMTTLAGLIVVLMMIVNEISNLFETIKSIFGLY